jgi:hypothetical protein
VINVGSSPTSTKLQTNENIHETKPEMKINKLYEQTFEPTKNEQSESNESW